jgi:predicted phage replisome organizer
MNNEVKWIKLKVGMFDGTSFKKIKRAKIDGVADFRDKLTAVWFELLDLGAKVNNEGYFFNNEIAFNKIEDIAIMLDRTDKEIEMCFNFYLKEEMIVIINDVYSINNWTKYQNNEGLEKIREQNRIRQQNFRNKQKQVLIDNNVSSNVTVTLRNALPLIDNNTSISNSLSKSNSLKEDLKDLKEDNNILDNNESGKSSGKNYHKSIENRDKSIIEEDIKEDINNKRQSGTMSRNKFNWKKETYFKDEELQKTFMDYLELRSNIKAVNTERAIKLLITNLEKIASDTDTKIKVIEQSIMNSWKGVFPLKNDFNKKQDKKEERKELDYGDIFKGKYEV